MPTDGREKAGDDFSSHGDVSSTTGDNISANCVASFNEKLDHSILRGILINKNLPKEFPHVLLHRSCEVSVSSSQNNLKDLERFANNKSPKTKNRKIEDETMPPPPSPMNYMNKSLKIETFEFKSENNDTFVRNDEMFLKKEANQFSFETEISSTDTDFDCCPSTSKNFETSDPCKPTSTSSKLNENGNENLGDGIENSSFDNEEVQQFSASKVNLKASKDPAQGRHSSSSYSDLGEYN